MTQHAALLLHHMPAGHCQAVALTNSVARVSA